MIIIHYIGISVLSALLCSVIIMTSIKRVNNNVADMTMIVRELQHDQQIITALVQQRLIKQKEVINEDNG